jgi:hypothetical protein
LLATAAVGLPLAGAAGIEAMRTVDGRPWFSWTFAAACATACCALAGAAAVIHLRWKGALVTGTVIVMLLLQAAAVYGYSRSPQAASSMKPFADAIWASAPDAQVVNLTRNGMVTPSDLSIYLNRAVPVRSAAPEPDARPVVVLLFQRRNAPDPSRPKGFRRIANVTETDGTSWYAFVKR